MSLNILNVLPNYSESHRFYHDFRHIARMFQEFERLKPILDLSSQQIHIINYSIAYHDIIYNIKPAGKSNEVLSAELFEKDAYLLGVTSDKKHISTVIKSTEFHFDINNRTDDYLSLLLCDLDLINFTDDWESFLATNIDISKEFETEFSKEEVLAGRIKFFESILENNSLKFNVIPAKEYWTQKAYFNIQRILLEMKDTA